MILRWKYHQRSPSWDGTFQKVVPAKINDHNYIPICTHPGSSPSNPPSATHPVPGRLNFMACFGDLLFGCCLLLGLAINKAPSFREQEREDWFFPWLSPCIGEQQLHCMVVLTVFLLVFLVGGVMTSCHCCLPWNGPHPTCLTLVLVLLRRNPWPHLIHFPLHPR